VIEEDPFFNRPGIHFPVFPKMNRGLCKSVGLAAGVQSKHIGFGLFRPRLRIGDGSKNKKENGGNQ
jgi:hypothetical protein